MVRNEVQIIRYTNSSHSRISNKLTKLTRVQCASLNKLRMMTSWAEQGAPPAPDPHSLYYSCGLFANNLINTIKFKYMNK